jgi:Pentapeptide repeats (8 copies)
MSRMRKRFLIFLPILVVGGPLVMANLHGANLRGAKLFGADLRRAWLDGADLRGALSDRSTRWPAGFDARGRGAILVAEPPEAMLRRCSAPGVGIPSRSHSLITRVNDLGLPAGTDERQIARMPGNPRTCTDKNGHRPGYEEGRTAALSGQRIAHKRAGTGGHQGRFDPKKGPDQADCRYQMGIAWDAGKRGVGTRLVSDSTIRQARLVFLLTIERFFVACLEPPFRCRR